MRTFIRLSLLMVLVLAASASSAGEPGAAGASRDHWAWKVPTPPGVPAVRQHSWIRNPVDAFILARLEDAGLGPALEADRETLLRRVTFDLIGLPPTPAEIDAFVRDSSPEAYEKVVDRLLASPHYGERWGRHWLDLARFAETNGYEHDEVRPDAWRYRDYVIRSFNADTPYDRFIREQLAGDELYPDEPSALIATGFGLLGPDMTDASDQAQRRLNTLIDMTDTVSLVFLGLTMGCARCHDHKLEPIAQRDYYRLQAFFTPAVFRRDRVIARQETIRQHEQATRRFLNQLEPLRQALDSLEKPYRDRLHQARLVALTAQERAAHDTPASRRTAMQKDLAKKAERKLTIPLEEVLSAMTPQERARHRALQGEQASLEREKPAPLPTAMTLDEAGTPPAPTFVLGRGELSSPGEEVQPGLPAIFQPGQEPRGLAITPGKTTSGRRSALAEWIASPDNPLTARVIVNRLWQHHLGRGLAATPSDFGTQGQPPSHPQLLDWLARDLVEHGWSLKHSQRRLLLSATYRQASQATPATLARDPENRLFSRMNRKRLPGEVIRDSLLAVSGQLDRQMGGPGVFPPIPAEALQGVRGWKNSTSPGDARRRSIYIFVRRNLRFPFLEAFDLPDTNLSCPRREESTTAPQALVLLNSREVSQASHALAERLQRQVASTDERIVLAYRLTLGRPPSSLEQQLARDFLAESPWQELCRVLFNLNEMIYLD